ncbi:MAG: YdcF family protein [Acidimicrobiales bacterium]|nr:YdcF family protein [Acidimicrobiales bacterium]
MARAFGVVWDHLVPADDPVPADAVFCFGSRHRRVAAVAARLHLDRLAPWVLATGGSDDDPDGLTEGDRLAAELTGLGVPAERIVVERSARHTGENVTLGVRALTDVVAPRRLLLVSWPLAARRCRATFRAHHPDVEALAVPALPRPGVRWAPTWRRIGFALGELDRLDRYARSGFLVAGEIPPAVADAATILRSARAVHDGRELVGARRPSTSAR